MDGIPAGGKKKKKTCTKVKNTRESQNSRAHGPKILLNRIFQTYRV